MLKQQIYMRQVHTNVGSVSSFLFYSIWVLYWGFHLFSSTSMVWVFDSVWVFDTIRWVYIPCTNLRVPRQKHHSIELLHDGVDPINNSGTHKVSYLDIPTKYQYFTYFTILVSMGRFFDTIFDIDYRYSCIHLYTSPTLVFKPPNDRCWKIKYLLASFAFLSVGFWMDSHQNPLI